MPQSEQTQFNKVFNGVRRALLFYSRFEAKAFVPQTLVGYLYVLRENNSVQIWQDNILPAYIQNKAYGSYDWNLEPKQIARLESLAVALYLKGFRVPKISERPEFVEGQIGLGLLNEWIFGSKRRDGFVSVMAKQVLRQNLYCPFCLHLSRGNSRAYVPKLTGSVCSCQQRIQEAREEL